ncbi:MAG: glycogen/starch synthase [Nanoarchaeota archaeon]
MEADILFEVSYEVCNKVGGIYTVISSKAALMKKNYEHYFLIGPYFKDKAEIDFQEEEPPSYLTNAFDVVKQHGIIAHYGTWLIKGSPKTILLEFWALSGRRDEMKKTLWEKFRLDSLKAGPDFDEPLLLSYAAALLIHAVEKEKSQKILVHTHEWMTGMTGLILRTMDSSSRHVFTTHATMLGRALSGSGRDLYAELDSLDPPAEADRSNVTAKFSAERICAHDADAFTTVSKITGMESEKILDKKPDVLLLNGLDMHQFPSFEQCALQHSTLKRRYQEFYSYYFGPYYKMNVKNTLTFFMAGRNEYRNKGMDITTEALARLNQELKKKGSARNVVCFFFIPMDHHGPREDVLQNKVYFRNLRHFVHRNFKDADAWIIQNILDGEDIDISGIVPESFHPKAKRLRRSLLRNGTPPLCSHQIDDEGSNQILRSFRDHGLRNEEQDKVKVILYPVYLNGVDGLLDMDYYEAIMGSHLGLFPSYYEPWGYTPLETAALGVPAITSDLSGFGQHLYTQMNHDEYPGIFVLPRLGISEEETISTYTRLLLLCTEFSHRQRVENKIAAKHLAHTADWNIFIKNYLAAHSRALK